MTTLIDLLTIERALEVVFRTVLIFFFTFIVMRIRGERQLAHLTLFDLIIIISIGSAVGDAAIYGEHVAPMMASMITVATVIVLIWILENILEYAPSSIASLLEGRSTILVWNGKIQKRSLNKLNMRAELLMAKLREKDVYSLSGVKEVRMEADGEISIVRTKPKKRKLRKL